MIENDLSPPLESPALGSDGRSPTADLKAFMRAFEERMAANERRAERLRPLIDATGIRVSSDGGEVTVTVAFTGAPAGVEFGGAFRSLGERELAALILDTYDRAVAEAARRRAR